MLGNFGGVKSSKLILDKFNEKKYESYSFILRMIKERYAKLYSPKEFSIDIINDIADNYYPKIAEWIYVSGKDTVKDKTGIILKTKINEFVNNLFPFSWAALNICGNSIVTSPVESFSSVLTIFCPVKESIWSWDISILLSTAASSMLLLFAFKLLIVLCEDNAEIFFTLFPENSNS